MKLSSARIRCSSAYTRGSGGLAWHAALQRIWLLLIVVKHVGKNVLRVFESLRHLCVVAVQCLIQRHCGSFSLFVHVGHISVFRIQQNLGVILEVHLNNFVTESKHDSVLSPHPFLDVNWARWVLKLVCLVHLVALNQLLFLCWIIVLFKVRLEVLK